VRPLCVVFADAFAYGTYQKINGQIDSGHLYKLTPGIGYSSNLHYQIFEGKGPDDVGFFTDYAYDSSVKDISCGKMGAYLDRTRAVNEIIRFAERRLTPKNDNIPYCERRAFFQKGTYLFMQEGDCLVFGRKCAKAYGSNVEASFNKAEEYIKDGERNIVVVLEELDRQGHLVGSGGNAYVDAAERIVNLSNALFSQFISKYPDGDYMLISDHGMADVKMGINVHDVLFSRLGAPGKNYTYFNDSVYLRFWAGNQEIIEKIQELLQSCNVLILIDQETRQLCKATNTQFGQLIYRLREGYVFDPSCFVITGHSLCYGMHGYMEHSDEASGIIVTNVALGDADDICVNEIYSKITSLLEQ
jgi:hypothetical protein